MGCVCLGEPACKTAINGVQQRRERRLRTGEEAKIIQAAESCRKPFVCSIIRLAVETGMRRGEILAIRQHHIDYKARLFCYCRLKPRKLYWSCFLGQLLSILHLPSTCRHGPLERLLPAHPYTQVLEDQVDLCGVHLAQLACSLLTYVILTEDVYTSHSPRPGLAWTAI